MANTYHIEVAFQSLANTGVLRHLLLRRRESLSSAAGVAACSPESVEDAYMSLGTHPDLVSRLWDKIPKLLPVRCSWVVHGVPVLVRPDTGVVFAFAGGTHDYALRLPPKPRAEMIAAAMRKAEENADKFGLRGPDRDRYLSVQAGDVHDYSDGSTFDISTVGKEWVFGGWLEGEANWCLAAFEHAA
jgi:hypothetical protein